MINSYLKIGLYNAGSLGTNQDNFIVSVTRFDLDLLAINETWLRAGEEDRAPVIPGYRLRHIPRSCDVRSRGGGVGFYVKQGLSLRTWPHPVDPLHRSVEQMWVTKTLNGRTLAIGTAYRPPWMDVDLFFDAITDSINSFGHFDNLILLGDFNINFLNIKDSKTQKLLTFLTYLDLMQIVAEPTHFTDTSKTLIDVICTNLQSKHIMYDHLGSLYGHCLIVSEFNIKRENFIPQTIEYRPLKSICVESFKTNLQAIRLDFIKTMGTVNDMVDGFNHIVISLLDIYAPVKSFVIKHHSFPWITDTIRFMMKLRDKALIEYHKTKLANKKDYYKTLKSTVNQALYYEKIAYFKHNINNKIQNPKLLWQNIKKSIIPKNKTDLPSIFNDPNDINNHFLNIPGTSVPCLSLLLFFEGNKFSDAVFNIEPVSLEIIQNIFKSLKSNAEGCDFINLDMLLLTMPYTLEAIRHILNTSIETCVFPDKWKIAIICPIPKNQTQPVLKT